MGPSVAKPFAIDVKMRTWDFLIVRITVGPTSQVQPLQDYRLSRAVLIRDFRQLDLPTDNVEQKMFPLVNGGERNRRAYAFWGERLKTKEVTS